MIQRSLSRVHSITFVGNSLLLFVLGACSITQPPPPVTGVLPTPSAISLTTTIAPTEITVSATTQGVPTARATTSVTATPELPVDPLTGWKIYTNSSFGLGFQFPLTWYGPDVYVWEQGLRISVGSDRVYPYGTDRLDQIYDLKNSYYVVIQFSKNSNYWTLEQYRENQPWMNTFLSLLSLKDGESLSSIRDLAIRVRAVRLGGFEGLEYISTLSETAQTEIYYTRQVVLFDEHLNTLSIAGTPNNVEITNRDNWRDTYRQVDEANLDTFYNILESITVE